MSSTLPDDKFLDPFYVQGLLLVEVVKRILNRRAGIQLSKIKSSLEIKPITEFMQRMRISSIEKFDTTTYISTINFYSNEKKMESREALGALVLYIEGKYIAELLKKLDYPIDDPRDEETLEDGCGTLCNLISGNFKSGLTQLDYIELTMSHFLSFRNEVLDGVGYDFTKEHKYEISIMIDGIKRIMVDLTMGNIPKINAD